MFGVRLGEAVGAMGAPAQEQECGSVVALNPSSVMPAYCVLWVKLSGPCGWVVGGDVCALFCAAHK